MQIEAAPMDTHRGRNGHPGSRRCAGNTERDYEEVMFLFGLTFGETVIVAHVIGYGLVIIMLLAKIKRKLG
jgi:hypothetical protein